MADLALIHPLLVKNPLPTEGLQAAVRMVATAGALLDTRLRAMQPREREANGLTAAWHGSLRPALHGGIDDVAAFAARLRASLPALHAAALAAGSDHAAGKTLADGLHVLKLAAVAHAAAARETSLALARVAPAGATEAALAGVLEAQHSMEQAWHDAGAGFDALLSQLREPVLGSPILVARLDAARSAWTELAAHLRAPSNAPRTIHAAGIAHHALRASSLKTVSAFRNGDIGDGADAVADVVDLLDSLAAGIAQLPSPGRGSAPLVGRHIDAVRLRAHDWHDGLRPGLLASMAALRQFGDEFVELEAPRLQAAFGQIRDHDPGARQRAATMVAGIAARLAQLGERFDAVALGVGDYLAALARASVDLESDTGAVAKRLQAGQARAEALACLASRIRGQIHDAPRQRWLPGRIAELIRSAARSPRARLVAVAHELDDVGIAQAESLGDAASLQSLLPALSSYLTAIDRLGAGVAAALAGTCTLQAQLAELHDALLKRPVSGAIASAQLQAALADWRAISRRIGQLPLPALAGVTTPGGAAPPSLHG